MIFLKQRRAYFIRLMSVLTLTISLQVCSNELNNPEGYDMRNTANPAKNLISGGQPSKRDLEKMAANGVKVVVNLRTKGEFSKFNEKEVVESLGMTYVSIPIGEEKDFSAENAQRLDEALNELKSPAVVHCASSNRVGGLLAMREYFVNKSSVKESIDFGKKSGMRSTEKTVRQLLK